MFASEKVMMQYFDQLLNEVEEPATNKIIANHTEQSNSVIDAMATQTKTKTKSTQQSAAKLPVDTKIRATVNNNVFKREPRAIEAHISPSKPISSDIKPFKDPEVKVQEPAPSSIEKLLQQVDLKQEQKIAKERQKTVDLVRSVTQDVAQVEVKDKVVVQPEIVVEAKVEAKVEIKTETKAEIAPVAKPVPAIVEDESFPEEPFQALFFSVAGLSLAVPLQELGGIHQLTEVNSLFGKPDWFKGVMLSRGKKHNVVDSARWVMPEKFNKTMEESLNYQYLIMLGESNWGLAAEKLVETESISPDAVKWRKKSHKRPWLMGTIKEKMCALLHVSDLIAMLEQGIDARQV